jgi:hypothetical protein
MPRFQFIDFTAHQLYLLFPIFCNNLKFKISKSSNKQNANNFDYDEDLHHAGESKANEFPSI